MGNQALQKQATDKELDQVEKEKSIGRDRQLTEEQKSIEEDHNVQIQIDKQIYPVQLQWRLIPQIRQKIIHQQLCDLPNIQKHFQSEIIDEAIKQDSCLRTKIQEDKKVIIPNHQLPQEQQKNSILYQEEKQMIAKESVLTVDESKLRTNQIQTIQISSSQKMMDLYLKQEKYKQKKQKQLISLGQQQNQKVQKQAIPVLQYHVTQFSKTLKSKTIGLDENMSLATQTAFYYQNQKIILTAGLTSQRASACFQISNLKYCVGVGIALKEVIEMHSFNYKSYENELSHGLYIITSQGYSWSHSCKDDDDQYRPFFSKLKTNDIVKVKLSQLVLTFSCKQAKFEMSIPQFVAKKFTLCFCAYLHEKHDSMRLLSNQVFAVSQ